MNVRPPKPLPLEVLQVQDDYLSQRAKEKGIVTLDEIPVIHDGLSILFPTLNYGVKKVKE